jgi:hypothetical protein
MTSKFLTDQDFICFNYGHKYVLQGCHGRDSYGSWIYNYLCNQCISPLKGVSSNPAQGEVYNIMW